jgi:hypothetical protein
MVVLIVVGVVVVVVVVVDVVVTVLKHAIIPNTAIQLDTCKICMI